MEPITWVLGGVIVAVVSGVAGKTIGSNNSVKESTCSERQGALKEVIVVKIDNLSARFDKLETAINDKFVDI